MRITYVRQWSPGASRRGWSSRTGWCGPGAAGRSTPARPTTSPRCAPTWCPGSSTTRCSTRRSRPPADLDAPARRQPRRRAGRAGGAAGVPLGGRAVRRVGDAGPADDEESVALHADLLPPVAARLGLLLLCCGPDAFVMAPPASLDAAECRPPGSCSPPRTRRLTGGASRAADGLTVETTYARPAPGGEDPAILDRLTQMIDDTPPGCEIRATLFRLTVEPVPRRPGRGQQPRRRGARGAQRPRRRGEVAATLSRPAPDGLGDRHRWSGTGRTTRPADGRTSAPSSTGRNSDLHTKLVLFSATRDPDGALRQRRLVVVVGEPQPPLRDAEGQQRDRGLRRPGAVRRVSGPGSGT